MTALEAGPLPGSAPRPPRSEALLAAIVATSDDAILSKDLEGTITSWNPAAERLYGYTAEEVIGRQISIIIPRERLTEMRDILANIRAGHRIEHLETKRVRKDGSILDVSLTISPVAGEEGEIVGASTIARDITERLRTQERLEQYTRELERSNRDLERFAYVVSHDLAEPLRMVSSYTQLLAEELGDGLGERSEKFLAYVTEGARRMRELIEDLLVYSRLGTDALNLETVELSSIVRETLTVLKPVVAEKNAQVDVGPLPGVIGDRIKLRQVIQNLIGNGLKFQNFGVIPHVVVGSIDRGKEWLVFVEDNGIGIDPSQANRVFEVFQRLHTRKEYPGSGIGLSVAERIVERHGGTIWVEPRPQGEGSRFSFTLPKVMHAR